jgi:hypothetical protein
MSGSISCRTRSQRLRGRMLGASGNAFSKGRDFAGRLGDRFQNSNHGDRSKMLQSPGTAISVRCAVRSPAPTESKTCWGRCIVSVAMCSADAMPSWRSAAAGMMEASKKACKHLPVLRAGSSLTPPNISWQMKLKRTPMPHSMFHGNACFA